MAQSLEELVRQSGDLLKEVDWNDLLAVVGAIVEGTATVHVDPGDSLPDAVAKLPAEGGELALRAGTYELEAPLAIASRSRVALTGAGASTIVRCPTAESAITLTDCREVTLSRMRVEGGTPAPEAASHINGAVTVLGGSDVTLSECTLACPDGAKARGQTGLTSRGGSDRLRVDRCRFEIGVLQTGALVIDPVSVTLERNQAFLRPGAAVGSVADAGIVVGGASAGTVRVLDNVIRDVTRGIHVGVSRKGAEGDPPVTADVVVISGNVITIVVPAAFKNARHAVFVGNANSISILDTVATLTRPAGVVVRPGPIVRPGPVLGPGPIIRDPIGRIGLPTLTRLAAAEGIRVYGAFGPYMVVRGSSLRNFSVGVRVVPLAAPGVATWVVSDTLAEGAAQGVDAPEAVEQERNHPAPVVLKPGTPTSVLLTPAVSSSAVNAVQKITATVTDINGLRVPSATVRFAVGGANAVAETGVTTDQNGEAAFSYTPTKSGGDTIHAYADIDRDGVQDIGEPFSNATHTAIAPDPSTLVLDRTQIVSTTGTPVTVNATVRDAASNPVANFPVHFTVTGVNAKGDTVVNSDATGVAAFSYTGGNQGLDTVRALVSSQAGERSATASVTYLAPVPAKVLITPPQGFAFKGESVTFVATVVDAANLPRPNVALRFRVVGANQLNVNATTDAQGRATLTYQGVNAGTDQITAFADINNNNQQDVGDPFVQASAQFTVRASDRVIVPSVIGLTTAAAKTKLEAVNLRLGSTRSDLGTVSLRAESLVASPSLRAPSLLPPTGPDLPEPGPRIPIPRTVVRIVAQNPAAGTQVVAGSAVNVVLGNFDEDPFPFPQTEFESS